MAEIKKLSWWHGRIIDWMLANPDKRLTDCAHEFKVTLPWLSTIKNSDVFKQEFQRRSEELTGHVIETVHDKTVVMTEIALDALTDRISRESLVMTRGELKEIAEMGLSKLGYGAKAPSMPAPVVNVNTQVLVSRDVLAAARETAYAVSGARNINPQPLIEDAQVLEKAS